MPSGSEAAHFDPLRALEAIRAAASALGSVAFGVVPASSLSDAGAQLDTWLGRGYHGEMDYLRAPRRDEPRELLPGARSMLACAFPYNAPREQAFSPDGARLRDVTNAPRGVIASYALGGDYHSLLKLKLRELADSCAEATRCTLLARACVDTAPLLEREVARRAGLGFIGKSGMLIVPGLGTYVLLGVLLLDVTLPESRHVFAAPEARGKRRPIVVDTLDCGACTACLDACPTGAFPAEYVLDARRCVSYLTIELQGSVPRELRAGIGERVFGCDVCQTACPHNASPKPKPDTPELRDPGGRSTPELGALLNLSASAYRRFVERSALRRVSRARLMRNAAIALGNSRQSAALPILAACIASHANALVRGHAAWALAELALHCPAERPAALAALNAAESDADALVRAEAASALKRLAPAALTTMNETRE